MEIGGKTANTINMAERITRPLTTIMLSTTLCIGFFKGLIGADVFVSIAGPVMTFWFATRQSEQRAGDKPGNGGTPTATASGPGATATVAPSSSTTP